jgi:GH35 family endo-1,4-beta-xylanase
MIDNPSRHESRTPLGEPDYAAALNREFGQVTAENETKWDATEPSQGMSLRSALQNHINQVMGRHRGQIDSWDVVNEAFRMADAADPKQDAARRSVPGRRAAQRRASSVTSSAVSARP